MNLKIYAKTIEQSAVDQVKLLLAQEAFKNSKVRIMPDAHAGAGCVIGFTANLGDKVIPNVVGVDIGCGVLCVELGKVEIDFAKLDWIIREYIPSGLNVHKTRLEFGHGEFTANLPYKLRELKCYNELRNIDWLENSLGTLGGGNHFIEIDEDSEGNKYLLIHTGSRNLGKQVCEIYQDKATKHCSYEKEMKERIDECIATCKRLGNTKIIGEQIQTIKAAYKDKLKLPKDLCYIEGQDREDYLHDMNICQEFANENRMDIALIIMGWYFGESGFPYFQCVHNYINFKDNIVRKGSISAYKGERLLIPLNMRDGVIIGVGKGNEDWNYSAPHGGGRIMSRMEAKKKLQLDDFKDSMKGIYTTSVCEETIDEAPMVYKAPQEIIDAIQENVEIEKIIKPIYNFKASE